MVKIEGISNIIDNSEERQLINVINDQLSKSKKAKFAIGYFFLSGFSLMKENFPETFDELPFLKIIMGSQDNWLGNSNRNSFR